MNTTNQKFYNFHNGYNFVTFGLLDKQLDFNSPKEFHKWLSDFFEYGNTITVMGEEIDYQYCIELI